MKRYLFISVKEAKLYELALEVATSQITKEEIAKFFKANTIAIK